MKKFKEFFEDCLHQHCWCNADYPTEKLIFEWADDFAKQEAIEFMKWEIGRSSEIEDSHINYNILYNEYLNQNKDES